MKIKNTFLKGRMNKDSDERLLPNGEYRHAENVRVANSESSDVGSIENSLSNKQLTEFNLGSNSSTLGVFSDEFSQNIYWFVKSDSGCYLLEWNDQYETFTKVLEDTRVGGDNVLNFNADNLITGVNVIIDSDRNNRLLFWTDDFNPPRSINIERAKSYGSNNFSDSDISVIKSSPDNKPNITLINTSSDKENNLEEKFISFAYRYKYLDGEYSALSPFSEYAFHPKSFNFDYSISSNESMINSFNAVDVEFNVGSNLVVEVDVVFKESGSNTVYLIESFNKQSKGWIDSSDVSFVFSNNKIHRALAEKELFRLYDDVPLKAKSQEIIGNRLVYGNYTHNYNIEDVDGNKIDIDLNLSYDSEPIIKGTPSNTVRSNRDYEVGIVYMDDYNRMTTILTSENNTVYIPNEDCVSKNTLKLEINSKAPSFAKRYRVFLKQPKIDYDTIIPTLFHQDGIYVWIKLEGGEVNKIKEGDFLLVKADTNGILADVRQTKVLEIKDQERNFLEDSSETETKQLAGKYFKIKPIDFRINEDDFTFYEFSGYDSSSNSHDNPIRNNSNYIENAIYYGTGTSNDLSSSGTYTGSEDVRYLIEIDSIGNGTTTFDTFRWSKDNGSSFEASNVTITSGVAQELEDGVDITFMSDSGHDSQDKWIVSAKSSSDNNFGGQENSKAYAIFKGIGSADTEGDIDVIEGGARIVIRYDEYNEGNQFVERTYISSKKYANIEEWFYGDNILDDFEIPDNRIWFRRGSIGNDGSAKYIDIDSSKEMSMIIRSLGTQNNDADSQAKIKSYISIFQSEQNIIFETKPEEFNSDTFYEIGKTYNISSEGYHLSSDVGDVSQSSSNSAIIKLDVFNSFCWGNGFESYKIKDLFNAKSMKIDTRPLSTIEDYRENKRISSLTYSGVFEQSTNYNALNEFNLSLVNYKDLDDKYGSIQKLFSKDTNIIVFQEDKVHRVLFNKTIIFDADGNQNVASTSKVLGQEVPYSGEYGISKNPESLAVYGNTLFFTDAKRGVVLRLSNDGLFEISNYGMRDWFRDVFKSNIDSKKIGQYDPYFDQYVLSVDDSNGGSEIVLNCGASINKSNTTSPFAYILQLNNIIGEVSIPYIITQGTVEIRATYNGNIFSTGNVSSNGNLTFQRDLLSANTANIEIIPIGGSEASYSISNNCPVGQNLKIFNIVLNDSLDAGKNITNRYKWENSVYFSENVIFDSSGVTLFHSVDGLEGVGKFPTNGSNIDLQSYKTSSSSGEFNVSELNRLGYLVSDTEYDVSEIDDILSNATFPQITTVNEGGVPEINKIDFTFIKNSPSEILYLIWDYRDSYINAVDDSAIVVKGGLVDVNVLLNDSLSPTYSIDSITQPSNGSATILPNNTIRYQHDDGVSVSDSFTYTISNGVSQSTATVNINVYEQSLTINSSIPSQDTSEGTLDILGGEPNEVLDLQFDLTIGQSSNFQEITFTTPVNVNILDTIHKTRTGTITLDSSGEATSDYDFIPDGTSDVNCRVTIIGRSSQFPTPINEYTDINIP